MQQQIKGFTYKSIENISKHKHKYFMERKHGYKRHKTYKNKVRILEKCDII